MSSFNQQNKTPKVISFEPRIATSFSDAAASSFSDAAASNFSDAVASSFSDAAASSFSDAAAEVFSFQLPVHGQGVFVFKIVNAGEITSLFTSNFSYFNADKTDGLRVEFNDSGIYLYRVATGELLDFAKNESITLVKAACWLSLDAQNRRLAFGIGEARVDTIAFSHTFPSEIVEEGEKKHDKTKLFLESIVSINLDATDIKLIRYLRDPISNTPIPMCVKNTDELTMRAIADVSVLPKANLSPVAQRLYDNIAGKNFTLNDADFPEFARAIEWSIANEDGWCYKKLVSKQGEFGKTDPEIAKMETYLRITLGENNGESPGIPYVMEIWPVGHYSPVHNHAGANAIIRVLHGEITVSLFPYLATDMPPAFGTVVFNPDDITWISPTLNQTHQLKNNPANTDTCITIQCYMYDEEDAVHYDYFDYLSKGEIGQYEPDSDMDYTEFRAQMQYEWNVLRKKI